MKKAQRNHFIERACYKEQRFYDVCAYIINNKNDSYDEVIKKLKNCYQVNDIRNLNKLFDNFILEAPNLINAVNLILENMRNKKNGIVIKELDEKVSKIASIDLKVDSGYVYKKSNPSRSYNYLGDTKEEKEEKLEQVKTWAKELNSGTTIQELSEKNNLSEKHILSTINKLLPKSPEDFVDYKISSSNAKPIDQNELDQYKELVTYFINNIKENIAKLEEVKDIIDKKSYNKNLIQLNKLLKVYTNCLKCLNLEEVIAPSELKVEEDFIKDYCMEINNLLKLKAKLKTNYASDSKQEDIYNIYRKKLNL